MKALQMLNSKKIVFLIYVLGTSHIQIKNREFQTFDYKKIRLKSKYAFIK